MSCTIGFQCPYFHFAKALTAKLRFSTERLLGNQAVRSCRACMDFVFDEVCQLEHIVIADGDRMIKWLTSSTIKKLDFSGLWQSCTVEELFNIFFAGSIKDRGGNFKS